MGTIDDLPTRHENHALDDEADTALTVAIRSVGAFMLQSIDRRDYGSDIQLEALHNSNPTNIRIHIQLKGTEKSANADNTVSISVQRTSFNYLLSSFDSLYACYHAPTRRLLVRSADDVYREYSHRGDKWLHQGSLTVRFSQAFDPPFQNALATRVIAEGRAARDRRLQWASTPPGELSGAIESAPLAVEVPSSKREALALLDALNRGGYDATISASFERFRAVLGSTKGAMQVPYFAEVNLALNHKKHDSARLRDAVSYLESIAKSARDEDRAPAYYNFGNALLASGEYERALLAYEFVASSASAVDPSLQAQSHKNRGSALEHLNREYDAREAYEAALREDPDLPEALFALAQWHGLRGQHTEALRYLEAIVSRSGSALGLATVHGWRAFYLFTLGRTPEAFRELDLLLGSAHAHTWIWPWCAHAVYKHGMEGVQSLGPACRFWRRYTKAHPSDIHGEHARLLCEWRLHDGLKAEADNSKRTQNYTRFKRDVEKLIAREPEEEPFWWDRIGHWAQRDGNWIEAAQCYQKASALDPEQYGYCLGVALNELGSHREALEVLQPQATTFQPDGMSWFQVGVAQAGLLDYPTAAESFRRSISLQDDYAAAWFNLGGMLWNSGAHDEARSIWRQALEKFPDHPLASAVQEEHWLTESRDI